MKAVNLMHGGLFKLSTEMVTTAKNTAYICQAGQFFIVSSSCGRVFDLVEMNKSSPV